MNYFVYFQRLYNIFIFFHYVTAYVLFAANLDDFKSIAKKFIPAKLAEQLADMASPTSTKHLHKAVGDNSNSNESNDRREEEDLAVKDKEAPKPESKKRFSVETQTKEINIDEIVEKVRIKLEKDFKNFRNTPKINDVEKITSHNPTSLKHKQKSMRNVIKEIAIDNVPNWNEYEQERSDEEMVTQEMTVTERQDLNVNEPQEQIPSKEAVVGTTEIDNLFQEIDMRKTNDSYEDYVTPKRDEIYENVDMNHSGISVTEKHKYNPSNKQKVIRYVDKIKWKAKESQVTTPSYDYSEEIKAKTESIVYDDTVDAIQSTDGVNLNSPDDVVINRPLDGAVHKIKRPAGTMIPTRKTYKMSSPNYYAKLPIIAEKYNFDEHLPERDREPENLKYIGNPPASINRKIKL